MMLTENNVQSRILNIVNRYHDLFDRVVLFGSYSRNQQTKGSDIDIYIESDIPTNKLLKNSAYNRFHDELYEEFNYSVPFDLLVFGGNRDRNRVKQSMLYSQIQNDGVVLYDKRAETV